jgi:soluble lytic murein transglycosylase-like protein
MQIMSGTASWMNQRLGSAYDFHTLAGNTQVGSEYLEWLIAYFGEVYYSDDFSLSGNDNLLNDVVSAYNVGPAGVKPTAPGGGIANPQYVADVEALETRQPWNG